MKLGIVWIQYHRMPKYIGTHATGAPSYIRVFRRARTPVWKYWFDIPVPKYGRET